MKILDLVSSNNSLDLRNNNLDALIIGVRESDKSDLPAAEAVRSLAIIHAETSEHLAAGDCPALSVGINLPLQLAHFSATCLGRFPVHRLPVNY